MSKCLISGSHGFIGSHLAEYLQKKGLEVVGLPRELLYDMDKLPQFLLEQQPEYIFHTAAYGNMANQKDPIMTVTANVLATWNLLVASKDISYRAFINFGSSSEYGKKDKPMVEEMLPEVDTFYGASKVSTVYLCRSMAKQLTKPIVTVRPFSVYGPGEAPFRFIPQIIEHLETGNVMDFDIDGKHDWIYIDDLISGVFTVSQHARELFGEVVNIGTGVQSTNTQIETILEKISGKSLNINYFSNMRPQDSPVWVDGSKKLRLYGWKPKVSLEEGLKKTYDYYTK